MVKWRKSGIIKADFRVFVNLSRDMMFQYIRLHKHAHSFLINHMSSSQNGLGIINSKRTHEIPVQLLVFRRNDIRVFQEKADVFAS